MVEISIRNIEMYFPVNKVPVKVLDGVNLDIHKGEFVSIIGPSGCGKSTLISLVAGLQFPNSGEVSVNNRKVTGPGSDRGVVFQDYTLFPWMTTLENIVFALEEVEKGLSKKDLRVKARQFLDIVGLGDFANNYPGELSGGMQQRVAIARAFALNPRILLMDEPFGAADALTRVHLQDLLLHLWESDRKTVLLVTHDIDEALILSDRIVVMTRRPSRVKQIVEVNFERPRNRTGLTRSSEYIALKSHLLSLLYDELSEPLAQQKEKLEIMGELLGKGVSKQCTAKQLPD
ncbi:ABC transporter ATP-binding protein [Thermoanaerobacterium sp. DL9XJH110]|uniref:ABC transporter ATP-binding protein n=1 Tax=Thermoanaerobacterium sp. DL9XJH110 TaxID=3386643 RepID=UPI003BB5C192